MMERFKTLLIKAPIRGALAMIAFGLLLSEATAQPAEAQVWKDLKRPGAIVVMRHALAPGTGDPGRFDVADCTTQRNLDAAGREQARRIGAAFRERGIARAEVRSSQWCRCLDTARLLGLGPVKAWPVINSFFQDRSTAEAQTEALRRFVSQERSGPPVILVTHQVNITGLTRIFPASGEMIVLRGQGDGKFRVVGRIRIRP